MSNTTSLVKHHKKGRGRGPSRETLANYPTERQRQQHRAFLIARCQAKFRSEEWMLSETEYFELWEPYWDQRGRTRECLTMTRRDPDQAWSMGNVEFITRSELWARIHEIQAMNRSSQ